ncbi:hypothetical protein [Alkalinema sp. FACHB-956]|uniref:hypothetical protein n=1 Tax=Alkalinema sp. FACHB-956 TaxID=2692768 RepID=UPI0016820A85|nr:hypothetical protein [Alkalinema sp. FACHB-956]MBD2325887.1 hypothetical protein [Alkalinema sp. FACHB-956]
MQSKIIRSKSTRSKAPRSKSTRSQVIRSKQTTLETPTIDAEPLPLEEPEPPEPIAPEPCQTKSVKICLFGHRDDVQLTINELQAIGFLKRVQWSLPMPISSAHGEYFSIAQYTY